MFDVLRLKCAEQNHIPKSNPSWYFELFIIVRKYVIKSGKIKNFLNEFVLT